MAWNQPGDDKKRPAPRGAEDSSFDEVFKRWQQRVQRLWRPGRGAGTAAVALALLAVAVWLGSGYYQIDPAERGVVQQFGRYLATEPPGHGWHWPWPIQTLTKVNVSGISNFDSKSTMLSVDQSLLSVSWSVQYRVTDPLNYLFGVRDPEATLRQVSETEIREQVATAPVLGLLGGDARARVGSLARDRIQQDLERDHAGLSVTAVSLSDVQLPEAVLATQRDAEKARDERDRALADAQAYASDLLPKAQSQVQQQLADASVYASQTVAQAQGEAERFNQLADAYKASPDVVRSRLYIDTMETILSRSRKIVLDVKSGSGNTLYLPLDKLVDAARSAAPASVSSAAPAAGASAASAAPPAPAGNSSGSDSDDRGRERSER